MDEQQQAHTEPLGQTYQYNQDYHKMSDFLGVSIYDRSDDTLAKKVSALQEWAENKTGKKDIHSALIEVSKLQKSLGVHFIGKPLVTELYKHMRLNQVNQAGEAPIQPSAPSMRPQVDKTTKPQTKPKPTSIQQAVAQTVQKSVSEIVGQVLKDKKLIEGTVQNAVREALK